MDTIGQAKELLAEERHRLALYDLVAKLTRGVMARTSKEHFSREGPVSSEVFLDRVMKYETIVSELAAVQALVSHWAGPAQRQTVNLASKRMCELEREPGSGIWLGLRWYPVLVVLYAGGIGAVAGSRYDNLRLLFQASVPDLDNPGRISLIRAVADGSNEIEGSFKMLPGRERNYTPRSERLFEILRPVFDATLFLGFEYESYFDEFEVLMALEYAAHSTRAGGAAWGPIGRFGWKAHRGGRWDPLHRMIAEATEHGDTWPPLAAGLCGGSIEQLQVIAKEFGERLSRLGWW